MAFVTKTWKDRLVEYAGRRKIKNVATGEETLVDVSRSEGTVSQAGDAFSAANMNNLEQRIKNEFDTVNSSLVSNIYVGSDGKLHKVQGGADTVLPFNSKVKVTIVGTLREGHYAYRNSGGDQEYGWYYGSKDITIVINPDGTCTTKTFEIIGSPSSLNNAEISQINGRASFTIKSIKFG